MRLSLTRKSLIFLLVSSLVAPLLLAAANGDTKPKWDDENIGIDEWQKVPGTDVYGQLPSTGPDDPYIYKLEVACQGNDGSLLPACTEALPDCNEAANGVAMYWYRKLAVTPDASWAFAKGPDCIYSSKPMDILEQIAAQINHEFQQTPVIPATVNSQPGPHTLRGQETNFYADAKEQTFNIVLLGQKVKITATPVSYTWDYGDGTTWGPTNISGAPLPADRIGEQTKTSHIYTTTGKHIVNVTTHFNGSYTVNAGPTLPIPDQGHITSSPLTITVWRAVTHNFADDCLTNPDGAGC